MRPLIKQLLCGLAGVLLTLCTQLALAHSSSNSFLTLSPTDAGLSLRLDVSVRDADMVFDLDRDGDGQVIWSEVLSQTTSIQADLQSHIQLQRAGEVCPLRDANLQASQHGDGTYISVLWRVECTGSATEPLELHYTWLFDRDPLHRGLVKHEVDGQLATALLSPERPRITLSSRALSAWQLLGRYVIEGVWHIWIGLDHVLFLISLLLLAPLIKQGGRSSHWRGHSSFRQVAIDVFKVVTAFTLAHSITLALSVLQMVRPPPEYIEPAIALSVSLAAFNNLLGAQSMKRWPVAFVFGLIHGFGFANVLLDLGLPASALVMALGGFNLGVELGQLAIVLAFLPIAWVLRHTPFYRWVLVNAGSITIGLLGAYWTFERMGLLPTFLSPTA